MTTSPSRPTPPAAPAAPLVAVACPTCFGALAVGADLAGLAADCPLCGGGFRVPPLALPAAGQRERRPASAAADTVPADTVPADTVPADTVPADRPNPGDVKPAASPEDFATASPAGTALDAATAPRAETELEFHEPVRTIGSGDGAIVLRRLTPAERAARRARRNMMMLVAGVSILLTIVLLLGGKR